MSLLHVETIFFVEEYIVIPTKTQDKNNYDYNWTTANGTKITVFKYMGIEIPHLCC